MIEKPLDWFVVRCPNCLANYTLGRPHVCPEWIKELVKRKKAKEDHYMKKLLNQKQDESN